MLLVDQSLGIEYITLCQEEDHMKRMKFTLILFVYRNILIFFFFVQLLFFFIHKTTLGLQCKIAGDKLNCGSQMNNV